MRTKSHSHRVGLGRSNWRLSIRYAILHAATRYPCIIFFKRRFAKFAKVYFWLILITWIFYSQGPHLFQNASEFHSANLPYGEVGTGLPRNRVYHFTRYLELFKG